MCGSVCVLASSIMDAEERERCVFVFVLELKNCVRRDMRLGANCPTMVRLDSA